MKNYVGIARDHSGSMFGLSKEAMKDYNGLIEQLREASEQEKIDTIINTVTFGINSSVKQEAVNSSVNAVKPLSSYITDGGTPLFDAVGELIEMLSSVPDKNDDGVSFLIMVVTDGQENQSSKWKYNLSDKIKELQATDKWTFTFRVPKGYASEITSRLNVHAGNVVEWEQSERGMRESNIKTKSAIGSFYKQRTAGVRSSSSFYADLSGVSMKEVKNTLTDISAKVTIWPVKEGGIQIRDFVQKKSKKDYQLGSAFYQLTKREEVQGGKLFAIRHKISGKVYSGEDARDLLGIPNGGSIKMAPGDHGQYDIFIQSTSVNRKLMAGTELMYWPGARGI